LADLEFIQFHPTVLFLGSEAKGQQPLISEAVRGEGAFLVDDEGKRFMQGVHPQADLAPRDIVSIAIMKKMIERNLSHVWLDARKLGDEWQARFPTIFNVLLGFGIDPRTDLIPVAPAQHYHSGGIRTDLYGRTSIPGLFACGEVACTGVHGANRLASNSLLEGLVFAERIGAFLALGLPERKPYVTSKGNEVLLSNDSRSKIQNTMTRNVGVLRSATSTQAAIDELAPLNVSNSGLQPNTKNWETSNLHTVATAIALAASTREETRGSHWREDFPNADNSWLKRVLINSDATGNLKVAFEPVPQVPDTKEVL
jgi:aspartate oxidase